MSLSPEKTRMPSFFRTSFFDRPRLISQQRKSSCRWVCVSWTGADGNSGSLGSLSSSLCWWSIGIRRLMLSRTRRRAIDISNISKNQFNILQNLSKNEWMNTHFYNNWWQSNLIISWVLSGLSATCWENSIGKYTGVETWTTTMTLILDAVPVNFVCSRSMFDVWISIKIQSRFSLSTAIFRNFQHCYTIDDSCVQHVTLFIILCGCD